MHCGHTWHDNPWPWASFTQLYNLQIDDITGTDLKNSLYASGQSLKATVSSIYNSPSYLRSDHPKECTLTVYRLRSQGAGKRIITIYVLIYYDWKSNHCYHRSLVASMSVQCWPLNGSKARSDLALIQSSLLLSCKCPALEQLDLPNKRSDLYQTKITSSLATVQWPEYAKDYNTHIKFVITVGSAVTNRIYTSPTVQH